MSKIKYVLKDKETGTFFMKSIEEYEKHELVVEDVVTSFDISHAREYEHKTSAKKKAEFLKRECNLEFQLVTIENVPRILMTEDISAVHFARYKGETK